MGLGPRLSEEETNRSILVKNIPSNATEEQLLNHFQRRKNGGGDVDMLTMEQTAIVTFESQEVSRRVLQVKQELGGEVLQVERIKTEDCCEDEVLSLVTAQIDIRMLEMTIEEACDVMETIHSETGIHWHRSSSALLIVGSFTEIQYTRRCLKYLCEGRGPSNLPNELNSHSRQQVPVDEVAQRVFVRPSHVFKRGKSKVSYSTAKAQEDKGKPYESHLTSGIFPAKAGNANDRPEARPFHKGIASPSNACHGNATDHGIRFSPNSESQVEAPCKVSVTGFPKEASEDSFFYYFENRRRSRGGSVAEVKINPELNAAVVTFESAAVAERVVKFEQHVLDNQPITVSFLKKESTDEADNCDVRESDVYNFEPKRCLRFYVSGFSTRTTEDTLRHYFENARRSGGGEIQELNYFPEENAAELTFLEAKDYDRLVTQEHRIDGQTLVFELQEPDVEMPLDPRKLYVEGLNPKTSYDCLQFYLERFSGADVEDIQFGCKHDNALVTFESRPDFDRIIDKVNKNSRGLQGFKLCVRRAPISCSVLVTGLSKRTTEETIQMYFEQKRSGGGDVSGVDYHESSESAIVHFIDPATAKGVLQKKDHTLDSMTLDLRLYHPLLEEEERQRKPQSKRRKKQTKFLTPVW